MIVGIQTVTDARIVQKSTHKQQIGGQVNVPVGLSLAAAGLVVPFAGLIDPGIHSQYQSFDGTQSEFLVPGEQVCALQYRKISHKWLSSRVMDPLRLSPTRYWSCMEGDTRNGDVDEDEEGDLEDIIEVGLEGMDDLGYEWTVENPGESRIYVHI